MQQPAIELNEVQMDPEHHCEKRRGCERAYLVPIKGRRNLVGASNELPDLWHGRAKWPRFSSKEKISKAVQDGSAVERSGALSSGLNWRRSELVFPSASKIRRAVATQEEEEEENVTQCQSS